jgi:hypothetical protein
MPRTAEILRTIPLLRPGPGQSRRLQLGSLELVFEPVRGGFTLLCLDGKGARTWSLGLPESGSLRVDLRMPEHPVEVVTRDPVLLLPGGRLRGYLQVPLQAALVFEDPEGTSHHLAELTTGRLQTEWREATASYVHCNVSPLLQRLPPPDDDLAFVVPVRLRSDAAATVSPARLPLPDVSAQLRPLRGHLVSAPVRLLFVNSTQARTEAMGWPEVGGERAGKALTAGPTDADGGSS